MKRIVILLIMLVGFCFSQESNSPDQKQSIFFQNFDLDQSFSIAGALLYEQGVEAVDSLAIEWEKQFSKIYLFAVTDKQRVVAYLDSDLNFVQLDSTINVKKLKTSLFLTFIIAQQQQQAAQQ